MYSYKTDNNSIVTSPNTVLFYPINVAKEPEATLIRDYTSELNHLYSKTNAIYHLKCAIPNVYCKQTDCMNICVDNYEYCKQCGEYMRSHRCPSCDDWTVAKNNSINKHCYPCVKRNIKCKTVNCNNYIYFIENEDIKICYQCVKSNFQRNQLYENTMKPFIQDHYFNDVKCECGCMFCCYFNSSNW